MAAEEKKKAEGKGTHKEEKSEEKLPFCTKAPSPEHARAENEDEPCDDGRRGEYEK